MQIKSHHILVAVLLMALPMVNSARAEKRIREVGNCIVLETGGGTGAALDIRSFCENVPTFSFPSGADFKQVYNWAGPFLGVAFEQAERAFCLSAANKETCLSQNLHVRVLLVPNGLPNAMVYRNSNALVITFNSGLLDFIDAATRSYLVDLTANTPGRTVPGGLNEWLDAMRGLGGRSCSERVPLPRTPPPQNTNEFAFLRTAGQSSLAFVFAHELAHVMTRTTGFNCGYTGNDQLQKEAACDQMALNALMTQGMLAPSFVVGTNIAVWYWQNLQGPALATQTFQSSLPFLEIFPATNWKRRSALIVDKWEAKCSTSASTMWDPARGVFVCPPATWEEAIADARRLISSADPDRCVLNASANSTAVNDCVSARQLMAASLTGFSNVKGQMRNEVQPDTRVYTSTQALPGAETCEVWEPSDSNPYLLCTMPKPTSAANAEALFKTLATAIRKCIPTAWTVSETSSATRKRLEAREGPTGRAVRVFYFEGRYMRGVTVNFDAAERR